LLQVLKAEQFASKQKKPIKQKSKEENPECKDGEKENEVNRTFVVAVPIKGKIDIRYILKPIYC